MPASSSSIPFERYDEEFLSLTEQVTSKLRPLDPAASSLPPTAEADIKMAYNLLLQADDLLKQMGLEARGEDDPLVKRDLLAKVREINCCVMCCIKKWMQCVCARACFVPMVFNNSQHVYIYICFESTANT
jgi:hypothetical protein